jgi:hypothetical protein
MHGRRPVESTHASAVQRQLHDQHGTGRQRGQLMRHTHDDLRKRTHTGGQVST